MRLSKSLAAGLLMLAGMGMAQAADKGGPDLFDQVPQSTASNPWSGCWAGVGIAMVNGVLSGGGPVGLSADGQKASGHGGCRFQAGMFVAGVEGSYGQMFGDLETIGIDREMAVTGTLGVLVQPRVQLYGHASWARLDTAFGDIDGWKFGPGVGFHIPNSSWEIDLRYSYGTWDVGSSGIDANSHEFGAIMKYRFNAK